MNMENVLILPLPPTLVVLFAALVGLILGSFYTACVHRYIAEISLTRPHRSMCPLCGHTLAWFENIPLLSYVLLRGRCSHCHRPISLRYVVIELISLLWAVALVGKVGLTLSWVFYMALGGLFIVGSFIDFALYILPNRVTLGGAVFVLLYKGFLGWGALKFALVGALIGGGVFWALQVLYRVVRKEDGLGTGDVKLMFCLGALVGPFGLPFTVLSASISALLGSVAYLRVSESCGMRTRIPFGPFLCFGAMLHVLVGREVLNWYLAFYS